MHLLEIFIEARDKAREELVRLQAEMKKTVREANQMGTGAKEAAAGVQALDAATVELTLTLSALGAAAGVTFMVLGMVGTAALEEVKKLSEAALDLDHFSQQTGASTRELEGLELMLRDAGAPAGTLRIALQRLEQQIEANDPALHALGITSHNTWQVILQLADAFAKSEDGARKTAYAHHFFRESGVLLTPVLNQGAAALKGGAERADKLGLSFEKVQPQLLEVNARFTELSERADGLKNSLVVLAVPGVSGLLGWLNSLLATLRVIPDELAKMKSGVDDFFRKLVEKIPGGEKVLQLYAYAAALDRMNKAIHEVKGNTPHGFVNFDDLPGAKEDAKANAPAKPKLPPMPRRVPRKKKPKQFVWKGKPARPSGRLLNIFGPLTIKEEVIEMMLETQKALDKIMSTGEIVKDVLQAGYQNLTSGISSALDGLLSKTMTFAQAMGTIFKSLVKTVLDELGKIAAAKMWSGLLEMGKSLLGFAKLFFATSGAAAAAMTITMPAFIPVMSPAPVAPSAMVAGSGSGVGVGLGRPGAGPAGQPGAGGSVVVNNYVNATDAKSLNDQFRSIGGAYNRLDWRNRQSRSV